MTNEQLDPGVLHRPSQGQRLRNGVLDALVLPVAAGGRHLVDELREPFMPVQPQVSNRFVHPLPNVHYLASESTVQIASLKPRKAASVAPLGPASPNKTPSGASKRSANCARAGEAVSNASITGQSMFTWRR